ncbi:sugar ABC transporter permease [Alcaligenaceae bacterium LF4-65]|jgi:sn-glycerol 3-phosphate transport system permease protein|uniref:Sugar ABC transporter permease n=1 Tax=Zwartia hollandica TaxID=324606 RepID=A0A953T2A1_9BURK|nr:sugar ABC transporter permease [Zwartia hollandica]MBZ1351228.1 sugar ABC transporter permease [Zwartia hollandica]
MQLGLRHVQAYLLLLPAFVFLVGFTHYPAVGTLIDSLMSTPRAGRAAVFVGLDNYAVMIDDPTFWKSLRNNFWFAVVTIPVSIALSIGMALWVNDKIAGRQFLRLSYFLPTVLPMIAVANIWIFFYTPGYGLINQVIQLFGGHGQNWLGDPNLVLGSVIVVAIWKEAGFFMIFYLAALQTLSPSYKEAAQIEGASAWYFFRRVQWPLLMPTTIFVLVNALINAFRMVDHIIVMTKGGPDNASSLLLFYLYEVGFKFWDQGYASALTAVLLALLALIGLFQFFVLDRRTHYR